MADSKKYGSSKEQARNFKCEKEQARNSELVYQVKNYRHGAEIGENIS